MTRLNVVDEGRECEFMAEENNKIKEGIKAAGIAAAATVVLGPLGGMAAIGAVYGGRSLVRLLVKSIEKLLSMREDPKLRELSEKLRQSNELYEAASRVVKSHKNEIKALHKEIEELVKSRDRDREKMDLLVTRLVAVISQIQKEAA